MFPCNHQVNAYNDQIYETASTEKVEIYALDSIMGDVPHNTKVWLMELLKDTKRFNSSVTAGSLYILPVAVEHQYDLTINIDTNDGMTNGATCYVKAIDYRQDNTTQKQPSLIWVKFTDQNVGQITRSKYYQLYDKTINASWTPVFDTKRTFSHRPKKGKNVIVTRIQFPLKPSAAKTIHKAQGTTLDKVVIDMGNKNLHKTRVPSQMHYVALSRVTDISGLYIMNLLEDKITQDRAVKEEMQKLCTERVLNLCYTPLYTLPETDFKVIFQNARSLHLHFPDIIHDNNFLCADVISIAESRLTTQDQDIHYMIPGYQLFRNDDCSIANKRPYHGLIIYIKNSFDVLQADSISLSEFESIMLLVKSDKSIFQILIVYKAPSTKYDTLCSLLKDKVIPSVDQLLPLIIMGDFNIDVSDGNSQFVQFMLKELQCNQLVKETTTNQNTTIDLIFTNIKQTKNGVIHMPWSDHKAIWVSV